MKFLINNLDYSIKVGALQIFLPDYNSSDFFIFQDLSQILGLETNYDAEVKISSCCKRIKLKASFDSEADNVGIYTKKAEVMFNIILLLNDLVKENYKIVLSDAEKEELRMLLLNWKIPKKQKWKEGDIFSIELSNRNYAFGQIVENFGGLPVCILFEETYTELPEISALQTKKIIALLSIVSNDLNSYKYRIVYSTKPLIKVPVQRGRDSVRDNQYSSSTIKEIAEAVVGLRPWEDYFDSLVYKG